MAVIIVNNGNFIAAKAYAPGEVITHTDGLPYTKRGTTTTATAFVEGWSDGEWSQQGALDARRDVVIAKLSGTEPPTGQYVAFGAFGTKTFYGNNSFGVSWVVDALTFDLKGEYMLEYNYAITYNYSANTYIEVHVDTLVNATYVNINTSIGRSMNYAVNSGGSNTAVHILSVTSDGGSCIPRLQTQGGESARPWAGRTSITITRIG